MHNISVYCNGLFILPSLFKNASAFLLRDARHAMHDILLLRISAILSEAISDGGLTPPLILICSLQPTEAGVISHLI